MKMDTEDDYYALLGVDSRASSDIIKSAFKRLALQYHPDVYKGTDAQERMRSLLQAYQTLSNPETRRAYDTRLRKGVSSSVRDGAATSRGDGKNGAYAFPDLRQTPTSSITLTLDGIPYELSSAQAESLKWDGLLRGSMPDPVPTSTGAVYICQRCHHRWSAGGRARFASCPSCAARDWHEYLLLRCTHCQAVFASKELRDPLHGNSLYHPYELFPLCPNCRRSHWCPLENGRVNTLRAAAARRAALLWGSVICVCVLLIVLFAVVFLR